MTRGEHLSNLLQLHARIKQVEEKRRVIANLIQTDKSPFAGEWAVERKADIEQYTIDLINLEYLFKEAVGMFSVSECSVDALTAFWIRRCK